MMITRLLPFVEKRLNLIELAPKGTGKSYIFGQINKNGNLTTGVMTRANAVLRPQQTHSGNRIQ